MDVKHLRLSLALAAGLLAAPALSSPRAQEAPAQPQNLQVLPKTTTLEEIKPIMVGVASGLGVKCGFCHDTKNYASDEKEHKKAGREMLRMVMAINEKYFAYEGAPKVTCYTCHRGAEEPVHEMILPGQEQKGSAPK